MHRLGLLALLVASPAHADNAFSVNPPFRWATGGAVGASGYFGLSEHHAIRANVARYEHAPNGAAEMIGILFYDSDGTEATFGGKVTDAGIGWMISPRRLCDGFSLELGALVRLRDTSVEDSHAPEFRVEADTTTIAGRALVGWSWRYADLFLAVQVGISGGIERGSETVQRGELDNMRSSRDVERHAVSAEGIMRLGAVFR